MVEVPQLAPIFKTRGYGFFIQLFKSTGKAPGGQRHDKILADC